MAPDGYVVIFVSRASVSNRGFKNSGKNFAFFEVLWKVLGDFGGMLLDFRGCFLVFHDISHCFTLLYAIITLFYAISP